MEDTDDARVCRAAPGRMGTEVDRKFDFLVEELKKYRIDIAGVTARIFRQYRFSAGIFSFK